MVASEKHRRFALSLLGPFQLSLNGLPVRSLISDRLQALLAYLVVESEQEHHRTKLAGLFWPDCSDQEALSHLRYALSKLRLAIGDRTASFEYLSMSRYTVHFSRDKRPWVDVAELAELAARQNYTTASDLAELEQANNIYRGYFLEGMTKCDSVAFEEWSLVKREMYHRHALIVFERLTDGYELIGQYEKAQKYAQRQLDLEPWREQAHSQLMRALALNGDRGGALAQWETCRRLLARELGVEPADETTAVFHAIRDGRLQPHKVVAVPAHHLIQKEPYGSTSSVHPFRIAPPIAVHRQNDGLAMVEESRAPIVEPVQIAEINRAIDLTLEAWARSLEIHDGKKNGHCLRVSEGTVHLARVMGLGESELVNIRRGALLHDVGKSQVPDHVLCKPGPLTPREWQIMRQHPVYANSLLGPIDYLCQALDIPRSHHEHWDGAGYPRGIKGTDIPLPARIFAVIDAWDSLRTDRPYRIAWTVDQATQYLIDQSGKQFDPAVVEAFIKMMGLRESVSVPVYDEEVRIAL